MVRRAFRRPDLPVQRSLGLSRRTIRALRWGDTPHPAELDLEAWVVLFRAI
jgi:hypothetical protein